MLPLQVDARRHGKGAISPKRPPVETAGLADIFPYYAGFSFDWACSELKRHAGEDRRVVLDPWNGSGTTTLAAQHDGHVSVGVDLNPVANVIAQARCQLNGRVLPSVPPVKFSRKIVRSDDPLFNWFDQDTTSRFRDWTKSLGRAPKSRSIPGILAIFRVTRRLTKTFEGSNPTWIKRAKDDDSRLSIPFDILDEQIVREIEILLPRLRSLRKDLPEASILTASASQLPLADSSIDLILTSPPYLTRIDYGVAYARELAVLGIDVFRDRTLRSGLMGTTLIRPTREYGPGFGRVASDLLDGISKHESKASSGYYLKQAKQYMLDLTAGFDELSRVAKIDAYACLVVQDSYYKDIPVPLADICIDEATRRGWSLKTLEPFPVIRSLMTMNRSAREYTKGEVAESVITLQRVRD
ncbi:hypothetical protein OHS58_39310 [Amycolatopsis sp. NBC_00348]|uniref:hypothetical protein n=1 Tax=Amycolatopsis sp. NBC_00348 TaxID=2975956 RepID=UPI002E254CE2